MRDFGLKPHAKGWRQTVGAIPDDELSRHAEKLRREWREQANKDWYHFHAVRSRRASLKGSSVV